VYGSTRTVTFTGIEQKVLLFIVILKADLASIPLLVRIVNELEDILIK
jgi:hypothetical protein